MDFVRLLRASVTGQKRLSEPDLSSFIGSESQIGGATGLLDANVLGVLFEQALRQRQRLLRRRDLRVLRFGALGERELGLHRALGHVCRVDGRLWVNTAAAGSAQVDGDL